MQNGADDPGPARLGLSRLCGISLTGVRRATVTGCAVAYRATCFGLDFWPREGRHYYVTISKTSPFLNFIHIIKPAFHLLYGIWGSGEK